MGQVAQRPQTVLTCAEGYTTTAELVHRLVEMEEGMAMSDTQTAVRADSAFGGSVRLEPYDQGGGLPLFVHAEDDDLRNDVDAAVAWVHRYQDTLDAIATDVGAVVLRGFALRDTDAFDRAVSNYPEMEFGYTAGATPRSQVKGRAYEATKTPGHYRIPLHQEMSYLPDYPTRLAFFCVQAPETGGGTLIGDARRFDGMVPRAMWDALESRGGVRYVRSFREPGRSTGDDYLDITHRTWADAFGTDTVAGVEEECRKMGLEWEWQPNGSISISNVLPGFIDHPITGKRIWFNQMSIQVMNRHTRAPEVMTKVEACYGPGNPRPYDARFADGSPIPMDLLEPLYDANFAVEVEFPWQNGDLMLLDNIHTFHGRSPFTGHRDVQVALLA